MHWKSPAPLLSSILYSIYKWSISPGFPSSMSSQSCWVWGLSLWMAFAWPSLDYPKSRQSSGEIWVWDGPFQDRPFNINCWVWSLSLGRPCSGPSFSRSASLFTTFLFTILVPLTSPLPNQQRDGFPLEFVLQDLKQTCKHSKLRAKTLLKLRTNWIMNRRVFLIFTKCCGIRSLSLGTFFSGPRLYYKVLSLKFGFWFGKALFRIRSLVLSSPGSFCKGNLKMQDFPRFSLQCNWRDGFSRDFCEGDLQMLYFVKCFRSLMHVQEKTQRCLKAGPRIGTLEVFL